MNGLIPASCLACGVCCHSPADTYVRVSGADWERLGADAERFAVFIGNRAYLRMRNGHCAALKLRERPEGGRESFCMVYERRPAVCRDLEQGSAQCEAELLRKACAAGGFKGGLAPGRMNASLG